MKRRSFLHTLRVRPNLIEPGSTEKELRIEPPKPRRRIPVKTGAEEVEMRAIRSCSKDVKEWARMQAEEVMSSWSMDSATKLITELAEENFFDDKKFGVYRHGGAVGWLTGLIEYPALTKVLVQYVTEINPAATFTSVLVSYNAPKAMHKDVNNDYLTKNYVIPVVCPRNGGELWVELKPGDVVHGSIEQREAGKQWLYGQLEQLEEGRCIAFDPSRYHEVSAWEGTRINLIAYTPDCLGKLSQQDLETLHDYGFPIPLSQLPEFHGSLQRNDIKVGSVVPVVDDRAQEELVSNTWSMYLEVGSGMAQVARSTDKLPDLPCVQNGGSLYPEH